MTTQYKLNYFNTRGQGEAIRFLLVYGQVPFEDNRISVHEWHQLKHGVPFGKLPTLDIDNKVGYETVAICRFLGRQFNLAGRDDFEAAEIDAVADTIKDLNTKMLNVYLALDCQDKERQRENLVKEIFPYYFSHLDEIVHTNGGFLVGNQLSWADFYFSSGVEAYSLVGMADVMSKYTHLCRLNETIRSLPTIQSWLQKRPFSAF